MRLTVHLQVSGAFVPIGDIATASGTGGQFQYRNSWLESPNAVALSASLPLRQEPFAAREMQPFFEGLLPEGDARQELARELGVPATSYLRLLKGLAGECIGAVSVTEFGEPVAPESYRRLTSDEVRDLGARGSRGAAARCAQSRLSLAGAQSKTGLYLDADTQGWFQPFGSAPSTHIVKTRSSRLDQLSANELWCMRLARLSGIPAAACGSMDGCEGALCIRRFDRPIPPHARTVDGLPVANRLHQEDLCQALGIAPANKYEGGGVRLVPAMVELIRTRSSKPTEDLEALIDLVAFNYLIGNCDAHLKNYSLLCDESMREWRLAPAYDLVSTTAYEGLSRILGMSIGSARRIDDVCLDSFDELARSAHISPKLVRRRLGGVCERTSSTLDAVETPSSLLDGIAAETRARIEKIGLSKG